MNRRNLTIDPHEEETRRRNLVLIGLVLIFAYFLPTAAPTAAGVEPEMEQLLMLTDRDTPAILTIQSLLPLVAGLAAVLLAVAGFSWLRGPVMILLPAVPVVVLVMYGVLAVPMALQPEVQSATGLLGVEWIVLLLGLAHLGLWTAYRLQAFRPSGWVAPLLGGAATIAFVIALLAPVLPAEAGVALLLVPGRLMETRDGMAAMTGLLMIVVWLTVLASVLVFYWPRIFAVPQRPTGASGAASIRT